MKQIAAVFIIACIAYSCNRYDCKTQPHYVLSTSVRQWFPYVGNGNIEFKNDSLELDTLILNDFFLGDDEVWNGDECPSTPGGFLRGKIFDKKMSDTIEVEIGYSDKVSITNGEISIYYNDSKNEVSQPTFHRKFANSLVLNGRSYSNVLVCECSGNDKCDSTNFTKFYFSKGKGLVGFEKNGKIWVNKEI